MKSIHAIIYHILSFYLHIPCSSAKGMNHTCLCLPSRSWKI